MNNFQGNSRSTSRTKRKKINFILNGSIVIVLILIAFVSYSIFSTGDNKAASKKSVQASAEKQSVHNKKKDKPAVKKSSTSNQTNDDSSTQDQNQNDQTNSDTASAGNSSSSTSDSSQSSSTTSPAPETPAQTGQQHVTSYDSSSQDWQEMLQTISSAAGIDQSNMTVWFLGSDKSNPGGSVGTVSAKANGSQKYRVYLQWDGSEYKATKVEPAS
ncbi:YrrS family protein [Neobacillus sp. NRS-1170]|uniref:YrrS family protein n=1 Tax=Neobacillus sp. NRS-1170 TaxID=3233898 RepID=UPI003D2D3927